MKTICISVDASCHKQEIEIIKAVVIAQIVPILKNLFPVSGVITDGVFVKTFIDVEGIDPEVFDFCHISNFCDDLYKGFLYSKQYDFDCSVNAYADILPQELEKDDDITRLAKLKESISPNRKISIPQSLAEDICDYCESQAIYDKLGDYGDFYYKLKQILNK